MSLDTLLKHFGRDAVGNSKPIELPEKVDLPPNQEQRSCDRRIAIPTEYRGVKFDSKSEAVFARILDLSNVSWEKSHPILHDGHSWDFLIWIESAKLAFFTEHGYRNRKSLGKKTRFRFAGCNHHPALIELKPSKPTSTYIENISVRSDSDLCSEYRIVVWGNPFSGEMQKWGDEGDEDLYVGQELPGKERAICNDYSPLPLEYLISGFDSDLVHEAKRFRFDLASV